MPPYLLFFKIKQVQNYTHNFLQFNKKKKKLKKHRTLSYYIYILLFLLMQRVYILFYKQTN